MKMLCWSCGKEYKKKSDGVWNAIQKDYVCSADGRNGYRYCSGMLISKKIYDQELKKIITKVAT